MHKDLETLRQEGPPQFEGQVVSNLERVSKWQADRENFTDANYKELERILRRENLVKLRQRARTIGMARAGFLYLLLSDDLAREVFITDGQRAELKEVAAKLHDELVLRMKEIEERLNQVLLDALSESQFRRFKKRIGKPLDVSAGHFELHALLMRDLDEAKTTIPILLSDSEFYLSPYLPR